MNEQDAVERLLDKNRERLKHNSEGASAYVWREYLKETNAQLQAQRKENKRLRELVQAVRNSGYDENDPRIDYVTVQIDRDTWATLERSE